MDLEVTFIGIKIEVKNDVAIVTMCNGDNRFTMDYLQEWNKVLGVIDR